MRPADLKLRGLLQFAREQRQRLHKNILALSRLDAAQKKKTERTRRLAVPASFRSRSRIRNGVAQTFHRTDRYNGR